jgi:acetylornithine deacetylase/succinyl-diaminopimelate desuccinylase-like protein
MAGKPVAGDQGDIVRRILDFVEIPTDAANPRGQRQGADWLRARLDEIGFSTSLRDGPGPPFIIGRLAGSSEKALAIYMMYDTRQSQLSETRSRVGVVEPIGRCLIGRHPIANKAAIELFLTAITEARMGGECPTLLVLAEGTEVLGSPGLSQLVVDEAPFFSAAKSVFWPRTSQMADGGAQLNLGYRGLLGVNLSVSGRSWGSGPQSAAVHSQYRPWVDAPTWRLMAAVNSLATADGNEVVLAMPAAPEPLPPAPPGFDIGGRLERLGVATPARMLEPGVAWGRLGLPSINLELHGNRGPGVGEIQPVAEARLQFRLPPGVRTQAVAESLRAHLDERGWPDISIDLEYAISGVYADPQSDVVMAARAMYEGAGVDVDFMPLSTSTSPTCAFGEAGFAIADGGLGYQDDTRNLFALDAAGPRAGVAGAVSGYRRFLTEFARGAVGTADGRA